jgi:hypothetical protein
LGRERSAGPIKPRADETFAFAVRLRSMSEAFPTERDRMTPEQRKAKDAERRRDAEQALREHELAQETFHKNRERLKAERLAREALAEN